MDKTSMLAQLRAYQTRNGHCYIWPDDDAHMRLRAWLEGQILAARQGKLDAETKAALDDLGVDWDAAGKQWDRWAARYRQLVAYKKKEGYVDVSQLVDELGPWLSAQRVMMRQGSLRPGRAALLDALGVTWQPSERAEARWEENFKALQEYRERTGHCNVPRKTHPKLGTWVSAQRTAYAKATIRDDRRRRLEAIGFEWSLRRPRGTPSAHTTEARA